MIKAFPFVIHRANVDRPEEFDFGTLTIDVYPEGLGRHPISVSVNSSYGKAELTATVNWYGTSGPPAEGASFAAAVAFASALAEGLLAGHAVHFGAYRASLAERRAEARAKAAAEAAGQ